MSRRLLGNFWNRLVMDRRNWWLPLSAVLMIGLGSMIYVGTRTYQDAPPIPDFVSESGQMLLPAAAITRGQIVFLKYGLMNYGSMFGDGAGRGPDFTADALHAMARAMRDHHASRDGVDVATALARAQAEIRENRYTAADNRVILGEAQAYAVRELERRYLAMFRGEGSEECLSSFFNREESQVEKLIDGEAGSGERCEERGGTRDRC